MAQATARQYRILWPGADLADFLPSDWRPALRGRG